VGTRSGPPNNTLGSHIVTRIGHTEAIGNPIQRSGTFTALGGWCTSPISAMPSYAAGPLPNVTVAVCDWPFTSLQPSWTLVPGW
jgi:hypothetical protein